MCIFVYVVVGVLCEYVDGIVVIELVMFEIFVC